MFKTIKEILQIVELNEFEKSCEEYRDVLICDPDIITKDEVLLVLRISANFLTWQNMIDNAVPKIVALLTVLEPVFGDIELYDHNISVICTNLCMSDISSLQYASLSLVEAGYQNNTRITNYYLTLITQISSMLEKRELEGYVLELLYCITH